MFEFFEISIRKTQTIKQTQKDSLKLSIPSIITFIQRDSFEKTRDYQH